MNKNQIELLAPAGSYEGFEAAIGAGADAVYVGGAAFGARAYAKNFQEEELLQAIDVAHIHGKKLYLTVNTLLKNKELTEQLYDYLLPFYEAGLDAVIVQDMGVLRFIRRNFPGLSIHASTQMTVTGQMGMKFLEEQGVTRVVAARELGLSELKKMHEASPIEIEVFIHGALCYCYSGQCLMSSMLGGRSGNRGRCAQTCRLPYQTSLDGKKFKGKKELCPLSLKDMCSIELLPKLMDAGVASLKIEGRMKQPKYTAGVTAVYRKYLDRLLENGPLAYQVEEEDKRFLLDIFNRGGSCTGYLEQAKGPSMMAFTNEKKSKEVPVEIRKTKEKIYGNLILFPESPAILNISCNGIHTFAQGVQVQHAQKQPMDRERIRRQMEKLGNTEFVWEDLDIQMDEEIFIPVKELNELRRTALENLKQELTEPYRRKTEEKETFVREQKKKEEVPLKKKFYVSCETLEQAELLAKNTEITGMYLPFDVMAVCMKKRIHEKKELYLSLPHIARGEMPPVFCRQAKLWMEEGMKGFLVRNLEAYAMIKSMGYGKNCVTDHSLYTWNDEAVAFWAEEDILRNTLPLELNERELYYRDNQSGELLLYGYLPLMVSAQCVRKNCYQCDQKEGRVYLKDRYGKVFPVVCCCMPWKTETTGKKEFCYNILYNTIPYGLLKEKKQVESLHAETYRLSFTMESPKEAEKILEEFLSVYLHSGTCPDRDFTKGHFKRGAE